MQAAVSPGLQKYLVRSAARAEYFSRAGGAEASEDTGRGEERLRVKEREEGERKREKKRGGKEERTGRIHLRIETTGREREPVDAE